jgi:hypothetical protein
VGSVQIESQSCDVFKEDDFAGALSEYATQVAIWSVNR